MTPDVNDGSQWERVAAELRACREAQQRAWGDIDNTTLGRYLAGEVTAEEHERIEQALNELPELRKLTDLVRDVLSESELTVEQPEAVPYRPATLPFSRPSMQAAGVQPGRTGGWKGRRRAAHFRQWVGLAAAASVLFLLGVAFPRSAGVSAPQTELALTMTQPVAMRSGVFSAAMPTDDRDLKVRVVGVESVGEPFQHEKLLVARIDASLQALQAEGHRHEAERLARQYADNWTRKALSYQEKGDLIRAEPALKEARQLCARVWGLEAPETVRSSNSLAEVYEVALNTTPPHPYTYAGVYGANPYSAEFASGYPTYASGAYDPTRAPFAAYSATNPSLSDKPPAVRSSSSYEPAATRPRSAPPPAASAKKAPTKGSDLFRRSQQQVQAARMAMNRASAAPTASLVALRDRLTSQSQSELKTSVVPVLTQALREASSSEERQRLARALGQLGPAARDAVPVLLDCCRHAKDTPERAALLLVLGEIGPTAAPQAVPVLVESLQTDSPAIRDCAARALVQLGPAARHECRQELAQQSKEDLLVRDVLLRLDGPEGRSGINDESECFTVKTIQETRQEIHELAATYRIEIGIETSPDRVVMMPPGKDGRDHGLGAWMFERAHVLTMEIKNPDKIRLRTLGERTVYFHINKDAADAQVFVSNALQKQGLSNVQLRQVLKTHLSKKDYDGGLREALRVVARFEKEKSAKK
jgi:hypothetical protein